MNIAYNMQLLCIDFRLMNTCVHTNVFAAWGMGS